MHVREPAPGGLLLPVEPVAGYDRAAGSIELYLGVAEARRTGRQLLRLREGDTARFDGPLGRGFEIDARSRYLLVVADADGIGRVRSVVTEAVATGRQVTVLLGAESAADVFPSTLLPEEAEYVVATGDGSLGHAGEVIDLVGSYEAWADQCFAAGTASLLASLARLATGRQGRMGVAHLGRRRGRARGPEAVPRRRAWLQVALAHRAGCALGVCLGCVVPGGAGPLRTCREGPAFAAEELRLEAAL